MSTTVVVTPAVSERTWLERWSPLGGLLFVLGALVLAFTPAADDTGETAAEVVAFPGTTTTGSLRERSSG